MSGSRAGGIKASNKVKAKDPDHYKRIGAMGGKAKGPDYQAGGVKATGFAANPAMARIYGAKGGSVSRRGKKLSDIDKYEAEYGETAIQPNPAML